MELITFFSKDEERNGIDLKFLIAIKNLKEKGICFKGSQFDFLKQANIPVNYYTKKYENLTSVLDTVNAKFTTKLLKSLPNVNSKKTLHDLIQNIVNIGEKKFMFDALKQLIKLNTYTSFSPSVSLEERMFSIVYSRFHKFQIDKVIYEKKEARLISQIISKNLMLAAKREYPEYLSILNSMINSYLELRIYQLESEGT